MLFRYLRAHWAARHRFPLPSRIVSLLRSARALLFCRSHRELYRLDVVRDYVAPSGQAELFRHFSCRHYLARDLSWPDRVACALHHYRFEDAAFGPVYKRKVYLEDGLPLWSAVEGGVLFAIRLSRAVGLQAEGDLSVVLLAGEDRLHCISFSWVSGRFAGVDAALVPFVARNQGGWGRDHEVQSKFSHAYPQNSANLFCFAAMEGIARAMNLPGMVGVKADMQVCYGPEQHEHFSNAYDGFWRALGARDFSPRGLLIPVPVPLKPLSEVAAKHRKRAIARRRHWAAISDAARAALEPHLLATSSRRAEIVRAAGSDAAEIALASGLEWTERRRARR